MKLCTPPLLRWSISETESMEPVWIETAQPITQNWMRSWTLPEKTGRWCHASWPWMRLLRQTTRCTRSWEHQDSHWMPQNSTDLWRHPQGNNRRRQRTPIQPRWQQREWVPLHGQLGNQPSPQSQQSPTTSCWKTLGEGLPNWHFPGLRWMGRHPRLHGKWSRVWQGSNGQSRPRRQPHGTHDRTPNQATYQDAVDWVPEEEKSEMAVLVLRPQRDVHGARRLPRGRAGCRYSSNATAHPWGWIGDLLGSQCNPRSKCALIKAWKSEAWAGKDPAFVDIRIHRDVQVLLPRHWDQEPRHDSRRATAWGETRR